MDKPWKVITAFIGVFIAGAVFGGVFSFRASARRPAPPQRPVMQLPPEAHSKQVAGPQMLPSPPSASRSNQIMQQIMRQFTKSLQLTPEQRDKIQPIVSRAGEDFQRLREEESRRREEHVADVARVNERMYADISGLLTAEQSEELQKMRQRVEEKFQADRKKRAEAAAADAAARKAAERAAAKPSAENPK